MYTFTRSIQMVLTNDTTSVKFIMSVYVGRQTFRTALLNCVSSDMSNLSSESIYRSNFVEISVDLVMACLCSLCTMACIVVGPRFSYLC